MKAPLATLVFVAGIAISFWCTSPLTAQSNNADWPQFRGPGGMGISNEKNLPLKWSDKENIAWRTELPGPGASSPIVVGERIFLTTYSGYSVTTQPAGNIADLQRHIVCLRRDDGKTLWTIDVEAAQPEQKTIRESHGFATSTPVADDERVYVFFGKSGAYAFDHEGNEVWNTKVGDIIGGWGSAASPILVGNLLIVNASVESESLVALNKKTGSVVWRAGGINDAWNTPLLITLDGGQQELVVATMGKIIGLDPDSGDPLWTCDTGIGWYMVPSLVAHEGIVYCIGGRSGGSLAVKAGGRGDVTETHRIWEGRKGSNVSSPVYHKGHLFWIEDNLGIAFCADAKTGKIVYEKRLGDGLQVYASALLADGKLYCVSRYGRTFVLAAKPHFELLASNDLEDGSMFNSSPAVADGRLFLRSDKYLYCIGE